MTQVTAAVHTTNTLFFHRFSSSISLLKGDPRIFWIGVFFVPLIGRMRVLQRTVKVHVPAKNLKVFLHPIDLISAWARGAVTSVPIELPAVMMPTEMLAYLSKYSCPIVMVGVIDIPAPTPKRAEKEMKRTEKEVTKEEERTAMAHSVPPAIITVLRPNFSTIILTKGPTAMDSP